MLKTQERTCAYTWRLAGDQAVHTGSSIAHEYACGGYRAEETCYTAIGHRDMYYSQHQ